VTDATDGEAQDFWDRLRLATLAWYHGDRGEQRAKLGAQQ
jgi:hypothetical protein